MKIHNTDSIY